VCDPGEETTPPTLFAESEIGCFVEILVPTTHVCNSTAPTPPPSPLPNSTFACDDNKCVPSDDGMSLAECKTQCPAEQMYSCDKDMCIVSTDGKGVAKKVCDALCGGGTPTDKYMCKEGRCEVAAEGVTKEQCEAVCTAPPPSPPPPPPPVSELYKCHKGQCKASMDEKEVTKVQCDSVCTGD
jgi:hypothetical protein